MEGGSQKLAPPSTPPRSYRPLCARPLPVWPGAPTLPKAVRRNTGAAPVVLRGWIHGVHLNVTTVVKTFAVAAGRFRKFRGTVTKFHAPYFLVRYEDHDGEDLSGWELAKLLRFPVDAFLDPGGGITISA